MERGYRILCLYEVSGPRVVGVYDMRFADLGLWRRKGQMFEEYVTRMMVMKTRHSEVPNNMTAEEYCDLWNERVPGMNMKAEDMNPNPAMRLTAKILLNSLWGKAPSRSTTPILVHFQVNSAKRV